MVVSSRFPPLTVTCLPFIAEVFPEEKAIIAAIARNVEMVFIAQLLLEMYVAGSC
jgi:hypothetical protein